MKQDSLDRALSDSLEIRTSNGFTDSVMEAVRLEAKAPPPLVFPRTRFAVGLAAAAALMIAAAVITVSAEPSEWVTPAWLDGALVIARSVAVQWTVVALLASLMSFRWSMRVAGYRS